MPSQPPLLLLALALPLLLAVALADRPAGAAAPPDLPQPPPVLRMRKPSANLPWFMYRRYPKPPERCCSPDRCVQGYFAACMAGALTPRHRRMGFFSSSGSCSGPRVRFDCSRYEQECDGNRGRCEFRPCSQTDSPWHAHTNPNPNGTLIPVPGLLADRAAAREKCAQAAAHGEEGKVCTKEQLKKDFADDRRHRERRVEVDPEEEKEGEQAPENGEAQRRGEVEEEDAEEVEPDDGEIVYEEDEPGEGPPPEGEEEVEPRERRRGPPKGVDMGYIPEVPRRLTPMQYPPAGSCCFARPCATQLVCRCVKDE